MTNRTSHRFPHACIAILTTVLAVACSRNDGTNERKAQSGGERGTNERVVVEGCLQEAPGAPGEEYVLAHVTMPEPEAQPQGQETMSHGPLITPGSWVRLSPGPNDLKNYVGQRVSVMGEVVNRGQNTIGTTGGNPNDTDEKFKRASRDANTNPERAGPPSTVPPPSADANGTAPKIAVEKVAKIEGACEAARNVPVGR